MISVDVYPGELEETASELEMCRRKLATLRSQKEAGAVAPPTGGAAQLGVKMEGGDRISGTGKVSREARELEAALEETKVQLMLVLAGFIPFAFHVCKNQCQRSSYEVICIILAASHVCMTGHGSTLL